MAGITGIVFLFINAERRRQGIIMIIVAIIVVWLISFNDSMYNNIYGYIKFENIFITV